MRRREQKASAAGKREAGGGGDGAGPVTLRITALFSSRRARKVQELNRKFITSPSLTTYSLPSERIFPASFAPCSPFSAM